MRSPTPTLLPLLLSNPPVKLRRGRRQEKRQGGGDRWQNESAAQHGCGRRADSSTITRWTERTHSRLVNGYESSCVEAGALKTEEEKHESAAAAAAPGSGFDGLPQ